MSWSSSGDGAQPTPPKELVAIDLLPDAESPATYLGATQDDRLDGFVFLDWETRAGMLTVAYPIDRSAHLYPDWVREYRPDVRCVLIVSATQFQTPDGPILFSERSTGEEALWRDYVRVIGQPAPYWPEHLAQLSLMTAWLPGHQPVTAVPTMDHDMTPLIELAGRYPCDTAMHRVMTCLYQWALYSAAEPSRTAAKCCDDPMFRGLYGTNRLVLAAVAEEIPEPAALGTFGESTIRAVFRELLDRRDPLAETVVGCLHMGGLDRYFPHARPGHYIPAGTSRATHYPHLASETIEEWLTQLDEVPAYLPDARFGYWRLLRELRDEHVGRRFVDRATDSPVVEIVDEWGHVREYQALVPRRLPATCRLAGGIVKTCG